MVSEFATWEAQCKTALKGTESCNVGLVYFMPRMPFSTCCMSTMPCPKTGKGSYTESCSRLFCHGSGQVPQTRSSRSPTQSDSPFLTNMFHFSPTVHTRLDSLSVVAAGQPLHVFPNHNMPQNVQQTTSVVEVQTQTMSLNDGLVETHTQTEALNISSERNLVVHARMLPAHIRRRLQEFAIQPDKAASDEIDFVLRCFRDSVQGVCILPCCLWDRGIQTVRVISGQELQGWSTWDTRVLILAADHWFFGTSVPRWKHLCHSCSMDFDCRGLPTSTISFVLLPISLGIGLPHVQAFRFECPCSLAYVWLFHVTCFVQIMSCVHLADRR